MTANQLAYRRSLEDARHNLVYEEQQWRNLNENVRHNIAQEFETNRSNVANETNQRFNFNNVNEHYKRQDLESLRHNVATEDINRWYNTQQAILGYQANATNRDNAIWQHQDRYMSNLQTQRRDQNTYELEDRRNNITSANNVWNYSINDRNAATNRLNWGTNLMNAESRAMDAQTNRMNYWLNMGKLANDILGGLLPW